MSFFSNLFKSSKEPVKIIPTHISDQIIYSEESIKYSIVYRNFKTPMRSYGYKIMKGKASIGYSNSLFVAATKHNMLINVPVNHEKFSYLKFSIENEKLLIIYDASSFHDDWKGTVELRFTLENMNYFVRFLK